MLSDKTVKVPSKSGTQVFLTLKSRIFLLQLTSQFKNVQMYINLSKYLMNAYCVSGIVLGMFRYVLSQYMFIQITCHCKALFNDC